MAYTQQCPRCGEDISGDELDAVVDRVLEHARTAHGHALDRHIVVAHLTGTHPYDVDDD